MMTNPRTLAVFDFDGTLVENDSFFPFLGYTAGWPSTIIAFIQAALAWLAYKYLKQETNSPPPLAGGVRGGGATPDPAVTIPADARTFIKQQLLNRLIKGRTLTSIAPTVEKLARWQKWKKDIHAKLLDHAREGHTIVIASGGLDLYLPELLKTLPPHTLICTQMEIHDGVLTGVMLGGNCVRKGKAEKLARYIAEHGPFPESWGYGNYPHDVPMLNLLKHRIIV